MFWHNFFQTLGFEPNVNCLCYGAIGRPLGSVTRYDEIPPLWQKKLTLRQFFEGLVG